MIVQVLIGIPASGKSTYAKKLCDEQGYKRVNKDDLRAMIDNSKWSRENESFVVNIRNVVIGNALKAGQNVVVDDTNLAPKHLAEIERIAELWKATVQTVFFDTPLNVCLARNKARNNKLRKAGLPTLVTDKVIYSMHNQLRDTPINADKVIPYVAEPETPPVVYVPPANKPKCILVDIDGTLAHMTTRKGRPFEWHRVGEDVLDPTVAGIVRKYAQRDINDDDYLHVIILSGRDGVCRPETEQWLFDNNVPYDKLLMRRENDNRKDNIIKREIFEAEIRDNYQVQFVLDDRDQVVDMWRNELGLKVLQVAEGDF